MSKKAREGEWWAVKTYENHLFGWENDNIEVGVIYDVCPAEESETGEPIYEVYFPQAPHRQVVQYIQLVAYCGCIEKHSWDDADEHYERLINGV